MTASNFFTGTSTHRVDAKGRVSLPADFRRVLDKFGSSNVIVLPKMHHQEAHLGLSEAGYEKIVAQVDAMKLSTADAMALRFRVMAGAHQIPVDDAGRIVLSKDLRDQIGIESEARFVGLGSTFQIWEPRRCGGFVDTTAERVEELLDQIDFGGLHG